MIRELVKHDVKAMFAFCQALKNEGAIMSFVEIERPEEVMAWIMSETEHIFGMWENDELIAVLKAKQGKSYKKHSVFMTAAVKESHRGEGLIVTLSDYVYPLLRERGIKIARAYIYSDNEGSVRAAKKDGFEYSGCVKMHHYNKDKEIWVDDLIFHKLL